MRTVILNGVAIGEVPHTGDEKADLITLREFLKARGLWNPKPKAQQMYSVAASFMETAAMLHKRIRERHNSTFTGSEMVPFVVNAAFSIEVFLKAIGEATGCTPWGHDLTRVYEALPDQARKLIDAASPALAPKYSPNGAKPFPDLLATLSRAFERWRYSWELADGAGMVNFQDAIAVLFVLNSVATKILWSDVNAS